MFSLFFSLALANPLPMPDLSAAHEAAVEACEAGDAQACLQAGAGALAGFTGTVEAEAAAHFYEVACAADLAEGCRELGTLHLRGPMGVRDPDAATVSYDKACDLGSLSSCRMVGRDVAPRWEGPRSVARAQRQLGD